LRNPIKTYQRLSLFLRQFSNRNLDKSEGTPGNNKPEMPLHQSDKQRP
jgi:hypothetical protein